MPNLAIGAANAPVPFSFESHTVRAVNKGGECWFVAADVCGVLDLKNPRSSLALLDDDEKGVHSMDTLGGKQEMSIINESGLYALILRSRKPEARRFRKWVTNEVLPAIRKTGGYIHEAAMRPQLSNFQLAEIHNRMKELTVGWMQFNTNAIANHLRVVFQVEHIRNIPADQFDICIKVLESKQKAVDQFYSLIREYRQWFVKEVLGGNVPWTPAIKRKLTQKLKRTVILPPKVDWLALAEQVKKPVAKKGGAA